MRQASLADTAQALLVAVLAFAIGLPALSDRAPKFDENVYIGYAWGLHAHGVYGRARNPAEPPAPGAGVAPLYPAALALLMRLDADLEASLRCHLAAPAAGCEYRLRGARALQLAYAAVLLGVLSLLLRRLTGSRPLAVLAVLLIVLTGAPAEYANHQLTETLYPLPAMIAVTLTALAILRRRARLHAAAGALLGLVALTRPNYFYAALLWLPLLALVHAAVFGGRWRERAQAGLRAFAAFGLAFALLVSPWLARNAALFGQPSLTVGYAAQALSSRLSYNAMRDREFLAGWIYFLPDFGDSLAERLFAERDYARLKFGNPEGFLGSERARIRDAIEAATGVRPAHNAAGGERSPLAFALERYVLTEPWQHARVSLLLAWRGLFVEKLFGLAGALCLAGLLLFGRDRALEQQLALLALPGLLVLGFNANVSVNIPRYNMLLLLPMALAIAQVLLRAAGPLSRRWRARARS